MATLKSETTVQSVALMTGLECKAKLVPTIEKGIRFHFDNKTVEAKVENVISTEHCTVVGNQNIQIMLIEHFMAACALCHIDSLDVYLTHFELPILDGGSKKWVEAFQSAGLTDYENKSYNQRVVT